MDRMLMSPCRVGSLELANRVVMAPHRTNLAARGRPSEALAEYCLARARGGAGLIVIGELTMMPNDRPYTPMVELYDDRALAELGSMAARIKEHGTKVFAQLNHRGFQSSGVKNRLATWGPSPQADVVNCEVCKAMEPEDIEELIRCFGQSALRLKGAGFDGLEVSIGPESILRQFLSPLSNLRDDEYGGDGQGRLRLPLEVLTEIRRAVGPDYPVGVELCCDERFWGGLTPEQTMPAARRMAAEDLADYIAATLGTYYNLHLVTPSMHHPVGESLELARALKQEVAVPVMAGGRLGGPHEYQEALAGGAADLVRLVRPLVCDPDLPRKLLQGKPETVRACAFDNQACAGRTGAGKSIGCIQNPLAGKESSPRAAVRAGSKYNGRAVVVGAGPAGLAAARALARRGMTVELYDKAQEPGGQVMLASRQPGRADLAKVIENLVAELRAAGVAFHFGREMDAEQLLALEADALIVATGSRPKDHPLPGEYGTPMVLNVWQALSGEYKVGERVLLIDEDGHHQAAGTAEFLADQGKTLEVVTSEPFVGIELAGQGDIVDTKQRLLAKRVVFTPDTVVDRITDQGVVCRYKFGGEIKRKTDFDTVVLAMGNRVDDALYRQLKGRHPRLMRAGDCVAPRKIGAAVAEGHKAGMEV